VLAAWLLVAMALHWARAKELQAGQAPAPAGWDGPVQTVELEASSFKLYERILK